jgi:4-amino-4-deoxy-L-arabinose transferase-like glycosyltransferase
MPVTSNNTAGQTHIRPWATYVLVVCAFACLYLITAPGRMWNADGWTRYLVAAGLVDYGWPRLPPNTLLGDYWIVHGRDGLAYSYYGLGQSLAFVPLYALGKVLSGLADGMVSDWPMFISSFLNTGVAAFLAAAVYALARETGYRPRTALGVAGLCGLGTLVWAHAGDNFDHLLETLCLTATLACLLAGLSRNSWPYLAAAGLFYGYGFMTRISIAFAAPGLAVLLLAGAGRQQFNLRRIKVALIFAAGAVPGLLVYLGYNFLRFGALLSTGYETKAPFWFGKPIWLGLATFLVSPGRGLLWYVPITLALPFLAPRFYRRAAGLTVSLALIAVGYLLVYSQFSGLGLWGWGPYYLLPLMPLAALVWGEVFDDWPGFGRPARWALGALACLSLLIQLAGVSSAWIRTYIRATVAQADMSEQVDWDPEWSLLLNQPANVANALAQMGRAAPLEFMTTPQSHEYQLVHDVGLNTLGWWWVLAAYRGLKAAWLAPLVLAAGLGACLFSFLKLEPAAVSVTPGKG